MIPVLTSTSNPRIKSAVRLKESRVRRKENCFLVDGVREIFRAWQSSYRFIDVFIAIDPNEEQKEGELNILYRKTGSESRHFRKLNSFIRDLLNENVPVWGVSPNVFEKLGFGDRNEGIVAVLEGKPAVLDNLSDLSDNPLIGVIEKIEKPGNVGAVFRSADGAGLDAVIITDPQTDLYNPNAIRASLGTIFSIPTAVVSSEEAIQWLQKSNIQIAAAICDSAVPYTIVDYTRPTAIVLGSESDGLTPIWSESKTDQESTIPIKIPMLGIADSLNISNAAAVLFYEARRQRLESNIAARK